jgi:hypothetical protein
VHAGFGPAPAGFRVVAELIPLPTANRIHLLVPARSRSAASAALRQFVTGSGRKAKLMTTVAVAGSQTGIAAALQRKRAILAVADDASDHEVESLVLTSHLARIFDTDSVELAVRVGADRPNGKPVVQVMTAEGEALGFGKIGWNALTRPMVSREAEVLSQLTQAPPDTFDAPAIVHAGPWQGFELMVVRPAITDGAVSGAAPPMDAAREVTTIGGLEHAALAASPWWRSVSQRLEAVEHPGLASSIAAIGERHGSTELTFGGCHGDWTPWNMGRRSGRLIVWDWERFHTGVPVGIDLAHFAFMVALRQRNQSPDEAQAHVLESLPARLEELNVSASLAPLVLRLHHVEMALRFAEARAQGVTTRHDLFAERLAVLVTE